MEPQEPHSNAEARRSPSADESLVGRFLIELPRERRAGLTAEEAAVLLETPEGREAVVYRIHRVCDDGRWELVGVSNATLRRPMCLAFTRNDVRSARQDFDRIVELAALAPPPCRVDIRLVREPSPGGASITAVWFVEACADAVHAWLNRIDRPPDDPSSGKPMAPEELLSDALQVVKQATLEPRRAAD